MPTTAMRVTVSAATTSRRPSFGISGLARNEEIDDADHHGRHGQGRAGGLEAEAELEVQRDDVGEAVDGSEVAEADEEAAGEAAVA